MVVMDSRNRRDGAAIEELGWYNPIDTDHCYELKGDRVLHWLGEGAQLTDAAHKLLRRAGIAHKWHLMRQGLDDDQINKEMKKWSLNHEEVQKTRLEKAKEKAEKKLAAVEVESDDEGAVEDKPSEETISEEVQEEKPSDDSEIEDTSLDENRAEETTDESSNDSGEEAESSKPVDDLSVKDTGDEAAAASEEE